MAVHRLPPDDALVETVFVRRRDTYLSKALSAFLAMVCPAGELAQAAD